MIISVGDRVNSQRGMQFRQRATQTLKQHLIQGYTLNRKRLAQLGTDEDQLMGLIHKTLIQSNLVLPEGAAIANYRIKHNLYMDAPVKIGGRW